MVCVAIVSIPHVNKDHFFIIPPYFSEVNCMVSSLMAINIVSSLPFPIFTKPTDEHSDRVEGKKH